MVSDKKSKSNAYQQKKKKIRSFKQVREKLSQRLKHVIEDDNIREKELKAFDLLVSRRQFLKGSAKVGLFAGLVKSGLIPTAWGQVDKALHVDPKEVGLTAQSMASLQTPGGLTLNGELFRDVTHNAVPAITGPVETSGNYQNLHAVLEGFQPLPKIQSQLIGVDEEDSTPLENTFADIGYHYGPIEFIQFSHFMQLNPNDQSDLNGLTYFRHQQQTSRAEKGDSVTQGFQELLINASNGYTFKYGLTFQDTNVPCIEAITHSQTNQVQSDSNNDTGLSIYGAWSVFVAGASSKQYYLLVKTCSAEVSLELQDSLSAEKQSTIGDWKILPLYDIFAQQISNQPNLKIDVRTYYDINGQGLFLINCSVKTQNGNTPLAPHFLIYTDLQGSVHIVPIEVIYATDTATYTSGINLLNISGFDLTSSQPFQSVALDLAVICNNSKRSGKLTISSNTVSKKTSSQGVAYYLNGKQTLHINSSNITNYVQINNAIADLVKVYQISSDAGKVALMTVLHSGILAILTNTNSQGKIDGGWYIAKQDFAFPVEVNEDNPLKKSTLYGGCSKYGRYFSNTGIQRLFRFYCSDSKGNLCVLRQQIQNSNESKYGTPITTTLSGYGIAVPAFSYQAPGDGSLEFKPNSTVLTSGQSILTKNTTNGNSYLLILQESDENLVLYNHTGESSNYGTVIWSANIANKGGVKLMFHSNGSLVVYNSSGKAVWSNGNDGESTNVFYLQSSGNLIIWDTNLNETTWSVGTGEGGKPKPQGNYYDASSLGDDYLAFYALNRFSHDSEYIYINKNTQTNKICASICYNKMMESSWQEEQFVIQMDGFENARCFSGSSPDNSTEQLLLSDGKSIIVPGENDTYYRLLIITSESDTSNLGKLVWQKKVGSSDWTNVWDSKTSTCSSSTDALARKLYFQADGNLVLRDDDGTDIWTPSDDDSSFTPSPNSLFYLQASDDGGLAIRDKTNTVIWSSQTNVSNVVVADECFYHTEITPTNVYGNPVQLSSTQLIEIRSATALKILCDHTRSYHLINRTTSALLPVNQYSGKLVLRVPARGRLHCSLFLRIIDVKQFLINKAEQAFLQKFNSSAADDDSTTNNGAVTQWAVSPLSLGAQQRSTYQDSSGTFTYTNTSAVHQQGFNYNSKYVNTNDTSNPSAGDTAMSRFIRNAATKTQEQPTQFDIQGVNNATTSNSIDPLNYAASLIPAKPTTTKYPDGFNPYENYTWSFDPSQKQITTMLSSNQSTQMSNQLLGSTGCGLFHRLGDLIHKISHSVAPEILHFMLSDSLEIPGLQSCPFLEHAIDFCLKAVLLIVFPEILIVVEVLLLIELAQFFVDIAEVANQMKPIFKSYFTTSAIQNGLVNEADVVASGITSIQSKFDNSVQSLINNLEKTTSPPASVNLFNGNGFLSHMVSFLFHLVNKILSLIEKLVAEGLNATFDVPTSVTTAMTNISDDITNTLTQESENIVNTLVNTIINIPNFPDILISVFQGMQNSVDIILSNSADAVRQFGTIAADELSSFISNVLELPALLAVLPIPLVLTFEFIKKVTNGKVDLLPKGPPVIDLASFLAATFYCVAYLIENGKCTNQCTLPNYSNDQLSSSKKTSSLAQSGSACNDDIMIELIIYGCRTIENTTWAFRKSYKILAVLRIMIKWVRVTVEFIQTYENLNLNSLLYDYSLFLHWSDVMNKTIRIFATMDDLETTLSFLQQWNICRESIQIVLNIISFCNKSNPSVSDLLFTMAKITGQFTSYTPFISDAEDPEVASDYLLSLIVIIWTCFGTGALLEQSES
ncbi:MAG: hypothetical protein AAGA27_00355 [Pseudomonadota bacterium]